MKLHQLQVTAFGPFAGTETIDFDTLDAAGLYLIQGPTGSGKTSILDAICFALYAAVPGARTGSRGSLHSDHADPSTVPQVVLEFTVAGRRLRLTRSPAFSRPKRNKPGETTTVPAKVALQELIAGRWEDKGTRIDEVALVVKDAVGLGLEQFVKVVLLPQGEFAAFLRATPEDRRGLLERLFDTSRFADIEEWMGNRKREASAAVDATNARLTNDLRRVDDVLVELTPAGSVLTESEDPAGARPRWDRLAPAQVAAELVTVTAHVSEQASTALGRADAAEGRLETTRTALEQARRTLEHRSAGLAARARLADLEDHAQLWADAQRQLADADLAREVSGHLAALDRASATVGTVAEQVADALGGLEAACPGGRWGGRLRDQAPPAAASPDATLPDEASEASVVSTADARAAAAQVLAASALLSAAATAHERHTELTAARDTQFALVAQHQQTQVRQLNAASSRVGQQRDLTAELKEVHEQARQLSSRQDALARLRRATALQQGQEDDDVTITALTKAVQAKANAAMDTETAASRLRLTRLQGMAGELADGLVDGEDCPVCGSADHPRPSTGGVPVSADDIERAEALDATARAELVAVQHELATVEARFATRADELTETLTALGQRDGSPLSRLPIGRDVGDLGQDLLAATEAATESAVAAQSAADRVPVLTGRIEELSAATETAQAEREMTADALAAATARGTSAVEELALLVSRIAALVAEHERCCPCAAAAGGDGRRRDLRDIRQRHDLTRAALDDVVSALTARDSSQRALEHVRSDLDDALAARQFVDVTAVRAASLPDDELIALRGRLRELDRQRDTAQADLDKPDVIAALGAPEPDLEALGAAASGAREASTEAHREQGLFERADQRLRALGTAIASTVSDLGPAVAEQALISELADCVSGNGGDNVLRMRLSSYVLAARLEEIARYANERLAVMSDGRYALQHSAGRAAHGARSGLGLRVADAWTGLTRDTATLSGGEAFMASLALALGLGDAVRAEAGGLDLQTLFVDEGFGTLDEESLEQVMAVVDGLREGGRSVGIVSHVLELRQRIKAQVLVSKTAAGSHLAVRTALGQDDAPAA